VIHGLVSLAAYFFTKNKPHNLATRNKQNVIDEVQRQINCSKGIEKAAIENREEEAKKNGMVIVAALFGKKKILQDAIGSHSKIQNVRAHILNKCDCEVIDVTYVMQYYVKNSQLRLLGKRKRDTIGFCNPIMTDENPWLLIWYH
jgi:Domain of unknown function (DUF3395)